MLVHMAWRARLVITRGMALQNVVTVVGQMMADRGYEAISVKDAYKDAAAARVQMAFRGVHPDLSAGIVVVFMLLEGLKTEQVSVKDMRACKDWMQDNAVAHAIVVSRAGLNHYTSREIKSWRDCVIETFLTSELQVNITHSCYYLPHRKVTQAERDAIVARYGLDNLWLIHTDDPVVRYFGWVAGALLAIKCDYGGHEGLESFRLVTVATK
jgi:DNA-directed RNA polymerase subunit H (RpoH/RPB5)